jgi:hypothetical protein
MKKAFITLLCIAAIGSMGAQKKTVDAANKLVGKTDKIADARGLIKQAMTDPETAQDARTYFVAGQIEFGSYDQDFLKKQINQNDASLSATDMADKLLNGYNYFMQALPLDAQPNEKGKVSPKYTKDIASKIAGHTNNFYEAAIAKYNDKKYYPDAYNAFMIFSEMPEKELTAKVAPAFPDSVRALGFYYAGICAYSGNEVDKAKSAFERAVNLGLNDPNGYLYQIGCWEAIAKNDSTRLEEAQNAIVDIAKKGYSAFGMQNPVFIRNILQDYVNKGQPQAAVDMLNNEIAANPNIALLYGLRGWAYANVGNDDASIADYKKAASMPDVDSSVLLMGATKIWRQGTNVYGKLEGNSGDMRAAKAQLKSEYFEPALEMAEKALSLSTDNSERNRINNLIDNINYVLDLLK